MEVKAKISFLNLVLIVALVTVLVFYMRGCSGRRQLQAKADVYREYIDSLVIKSVKDSVRWANERKMEASARNELQKEKDSSDRKYDSTRKVINMLSKMAVGMGLEIKDLRNALPDSSFIQVHPDYVGQCDSLADVVQKLNGNIWQLNSYKEIADKIQDRANKSWAADLRREKQRTDSALLAIGAIDTAFKKYQKKTEIRNSVWIGPELNVSPMYAQVGGQFMFVGKSGTAWQGAVGLMSNASYYARAGVVFKISFRKK